MAGHKWPPISNPFNLFQTHSLIRFSPEARKKDSLTAVFFRVRYLPLIVYPKILVTFADISNV